MLYDDLASWDGRSRREAQEAKDILCLRLIHVVVQQKLIQNCKAIIHL